ncbi:O-antigen ligase family protein [Rhodoferax sp.]|uniref:O-antigen ligase family protein n=1 Tax=Rhodoferax sp. TaxID=50421 RepID=UPI003BB4FB78
MSFTLTPAASRVARTYQVAIVLLGLSLPISTAIDNLLLFVILIGWLLCGDWQNKWEKLRASPLSWVLLAFLLLLALGTAWGYGSAAERLHYFSKYAVLLLPLALIALPLAETQKRRAAAAFGLGILLTLVLSFAIWAGVDLPDWLSKNNDASNPVVFKLHITHSFIAALGAFMFFVGALHARDRRWRWGLGFAAALAVVNLLIVQGRTGQLVLLVLTGYLFIQRFRWRGVIVAGTVIAVAGIVISQLPDVPVMARYSDGMKEIQNWQYGNKDQTSMGLRMQYAATSLRIIAEHPLIGVGTGGFEHAYGQQIAGTAAQASNNPHNQYLLTTTQIGLPGLLLLLAMFVVLWRTSRRLPLAEQVLARGLVLAYLVGNLFNSFLLDHTEKLLFAWAVGLLFSGLSAGRKNADGSK